MGFLDIVGELNPFKKKDDFGGLPPLDSSSGFNDQHADPGQNLGINDMGHDPGANTAMGQGYSDPASNLAMGDHHSSFAQQDMTHSTTATAFDTGVQQGPMSDSRMSMAPGATLNDSHYTPRPEYQEPAQQHPLHSEKHVTLDKELELISSKLDYLKASLDAINQRLVNLEHTARQEVQLQTQQRRW